MFGKRTAFTLVELLVVIMIIGILLALLMPAVQMARESARKTSCFNNLRQIGTAMHNYHDTWKVLPPGWLATDPSTSQPHAEGQPGWGWAAFLLPYMEQTNLSESISYHLPITAAANDEAREFLIPSYRCPSDIADDRFDLVDDSNPAIVVARLSTASYIGCFGTMELEVCEGLPVGTVCQSDGVFFHQSTVSFSDIRDGLSNTMIVGERTAKFGESAWHGYVQDGEEAFARFLGVADHPPNQEGGHLDDFSSSHPGVTNILLGDCSVRPIIEVIDASVWHALATRMRGEADTLPD